MAVIIYFHIAADNALFQSGPAPILTSPQATMPFIQTVDNTAIIPDNAVPG
jgi:hypothetical protein